MIIIIKVYNTLTRKKEIFNSLEPNKVLMYVCGPTVYDYLHIGNARPYVVFDTIRRYLEYKGYEVIYVQNFTDIDDKIINRANQENKSFEQIANKFIEEALIDERNLNIKESMHPRASFVIKEIIDFILELIKKDFAYEINGTVYFDTSKSKDYGKLANKNLDDLISGNRVLEDKNKKNPTDFVLWKPYKPGEPKWDSPWGLGRPGWHTECCAMIKKYLGDIIDIHAGGEDLIFPHHENEIVQFEAYSNKKFVNYWLHNGFININNEKMSKSKNNFFMIREIAEKYSYMALRFFILSVNYRRPINFCNEQLEAAKISLERIKTCLINIDYLLANKNIINKSDITSEEKNLCNKCNEYISLFEKNMDDDFNTADAISIIFDLVKFININLAKYDFIEFASYAKNKLLVMCNILGLKFDLALKNLDKDISNNFDSDQEQNIKNLIEERNIAKKNKDWSRADEIRNNLLKLGIILEDTKSGTRWFYK